MTVLGLVVPVTTGVVSVAGDNVTYAAKGDQGVDWSRYQGSQGI